MKKIVRLIKYLLLSVVFIAFALLRGVTGWHSEKSLDGKRLSKDDLQKLFPHISKANADVGGSGFGDDGDDGSSSDGSDSGC